MPQCGTVGSIVTEQNSLCGQIASEEKNVNKREENKSSLGQKMRKIVKNEINTHIQKEAEKSSVRRLSV
jgi:hypothetical protein